MYVIHMFAQGLVLEYKSTQWHNSIDHWLANWACVSNYMKCLGTQLPVYIQCWRERDVSQIDSVVYDSNHLALLVVAYTWKTTSSTAPSPLPLAR